MLYGGGSTYLPPLTFTVLVTYLRTHLTEAGIG